VWLHQGIDGHDPCWVVLRMAFSITVLRSGGEIDTHGVFSLASRPPWSSRRAKDVGEFWTWERCTWQEKKGEE
jgi:hypothetical protein